MHLPTRATAASDFALPPESTFVGVCRARAHVQGAERVFTFLDEAGEVSVSYAELDAGARAVAALLQRHLAPGDRALLLYPPGREYVLGFLGCLYAGVVAVPAYPPDPLRLGRTLPRLQALVADCGARVALTTEALAGLVEPLTEDAPDLRALTWLATDGVGLDAAEAWREPVLDGDAVAFLQYTSGSTGTPRGVVLRHRHLLHNAGLIAQGFDASPGPVGVIWLPPYHDMGLIGGILQPLFRDIPTVLMPPLDFLQRPLKWLEAVSRHGGTVSGGPNFAFDLCVRKSTPEERAALDLSRWEVAFCGAEPVRAATLERFAEAFAPSGFRREAFYPCYGLAEGTLIVTGGRRAAEPVVRRFSRDALGQGTARAARDGEVESVLVGCGAALGGQQVRVVDPETGTPREPGQVGEIWVRGPSVADGYWKRPEDSAATFDARPRGDAESGGFLRTGDLGALEAGGELFVTGRIKDVLVLRGRNHYPQDLESSVERCHPAVRPGCGAAFSVEVVGEERLAVVYEVSSRAAESGGLSDVVTRIRAVLSEEHGLAAAAVVLVSAGSVPKTSSGKVQRRATREAFLAGALDAVHGWHEASTLSAQDEVPATRGAAQGDGDEVQPWLVSRVARLLGLEARALEVDAPLTSQGLDSLRALEVLHAVEEGWGVSLPPALLLRGPSIRELTAWVERERMREGAGPSEVGTEADARQISDGQRALWFLQRMAPGSTAYHVARALRLTSPVDVEALRRAFSSLVSRHPALSTAFPEEQGGPVSRIAATTPALDVEDASTWSPTVLQERLDAEAQRPFELERGPLVRVLLFTGVAGGPVLLLVIHHLVTDLWSLEVLAEELGVLYTAEVSGKTAALPPSGSAAAALQALRARTTGDREEALWVWWRERLRGELPALELPTSRPRPRLQSFRGAVLPFQLDADISARLKALAQARGATPFMVLLAGWFAFLRRYTGQEDMVVGTPTAGRPLAGLARQVGYFVNPVALRATVPGTQTFSELLAQVRGVALEALEHQDLPFPRLVERLQPRRDPSRSPVFQSVFALQSGRPGREPLGAFALGTPGARARLGALEIESVPLGHRAAAFDVTLMMTERDGGFSASLEYCTDLFDPEAAARLVRHLRALLESAARTPDARLLDLPMSDAGERRDLLALGAGAPLAGGSTHEEEAAGLHRLFEAWAHRTPEAVALVAGERRWTYRELEAWTGRIAARLRRQGVGPEVRVGALLERGGPEPVVAFLAVLKAGGVVVPIEAAYPAERVSWILQDSGAKVLLSHARLASRLTVPDGVDVLRWEEHAAVDERADGPTESLTPPHPDSAAYLIYTSGSTGRPKGVVVTHRGAVLLAAAGAERLRLGAGDRVLQFSSPSFDASVFDYLNALATGAALHLPPPGELLAGEALHRMLRAQRITAAVLPPSVMALLPPEPLPDLKMMMAGGEACPQDLVERFAPGRVFINAYGPTEITVCATMSTCSAGAPSVAIGRPLPHIQAYVVDEALRLVSRGVAGELCIGGGALARGYLGRPELTAERFVPDAFSGESGARLYRTGDVVRWREDGQLDFLGRVDAQVKLRGFRIEPGEVETALREKAGMRQAHVTVWRPPAGGEPRLVAYVVPPPGESVPAGEVRARLRAHLPEHLVPADVLFLEAVPLTSSGKVDRSALPPPSRTVAPEGAPRTPLEETVARAWAEALGLPAVGVHAHFFDDLGGSSLGAVRACSHLREALGRDIPITWFFEHPTVNAFARRLTSEADAAGTAPTPSPKHQERAEARRQVLQRRGGRKP